MVGTDSRWMTRQVKISVTTAPHEGCKQTIRIRSLTVLSGRGWPEMRAGACPGCRDASAPGVLGILLDRVPALTGARTQGAG